MVIFLNNIFIGIMKKKHSLVIIDCGENDIQTDIKRLPYVAHHDRIVVQCVEFLDAPGVWRILLLFDN